MSKITVNDITYTAEKDICNCLDDYFCDVGKNLSSGIPYQLHDFTKYCHVPNNNSMFCTPASPAEILKIISSFKDNKAPGSDNIAPKLLKLISADVIEPLSHIHLTCRSVLAKYHTHLKLLRLSRYIKKVTRTNLAIIDQSH